MKIEIKQLEDWIAAGIVQPGEGWGDAKETACLMSALTGRTSLEGCEAEGWPRWLAEHGTEIFDNAGDDWRERSIAFANAVQEAIERGADFDRVFRDIRLKSVLPIAMEAIGEGNEPWRVDCRAVVQWSIDNDGAGSCEAARAAGAARAAEAAGAARAAGAEAHRRIFEATIEALEGK